MLLVSVWVILRFTSSSSVVFLLHSCQILTDPVEDDDGGVDGISHNGQHAGNEGIAHRDPCHRVEGQYHQHVMYQRQPRHWWQNGYP